MNHEEAEELFHANIDYFSGKYPRLREVGGKLILVIHAFEDKLPMVKALLKHGMLAVIVLKKSSSEMQPEIAAEITRLAAEYGVPALRSATVYNEDFNWLNWIDPKSHILVADHGCYLSHDNVKKIADHLEGRFLGGTEHTINGLMLHVFGFPQRLAWPYVPTACEILKQGSDREIAGSIADLSTEMTYNASGFNVMDPYSDAAVFILGYGTMGMHCADRLRYMGCKSEILVYDPDPVKAALSRQHKFRPVASIEEGLPQSGLIITATNTVVGMPPVFKPSHYPLFRADACVSSVTSFTDEGRIENMVRQGVVRLVGFEGKAGVYETAAGKRIKIHLNGRPTNTALANGGVGDAIYPAEMATIGGCFYAAHWAGRRKNFPIMALPPEDSEAIASMWLQHVNGPLIPPRSRPGRRRSPVRHPDIAVPG